MLEATLKTKHNVHIETYLRKTRIFSKKSKIFTAHNIEKFLNEAPDCNFLAAKVVLIIGISGACRNNELLQLTVNNIEKHSDKLLLVKLKNTKTNLDRSFVVGTRRISNYCRKIPKFTSSQYKNRPIFHTIP